MECMRLIRILRRLCGHKHTVIIVIALPIFLSAVSVMNGEEIAATRFMSKDSAGALSITSKKMTLVNQENMIVFEGDVVLERDSMIIKAKKVDVAFAPFSEKEQGFVDAADKKRELSTITATGNVEFVQGRRTILSQKVLYNKKDEKMIFTGSPNVREGEDELKGERITVYIREDRVVVDGGEAIIHPR